MSTATVLAMLEERLDFGDMTFSIRREAPEEPPVARVLSAWISLDGIPAHHMYVEALTAHEAHGLARKAAFVLFPGRPFTTVIRSN